MVAVDTSKTHRVYWLLKEQIAGGVLTPGARLPSEPELARAHGLSRVTIRRALDGLQRDGLIVRRPGDGTYVKKTAPSAVKTGLTDIFGQLLAMGAETEVRLLAFAYGVPSGAVGTALGLAPSAKTQQATRVRLRDGVPLSHLTTHVPEDIGRTYSRAELGKQSLLSLLERSGVDVARAEQTLTATLAAPDIAGALQVPVGAPLIALTRIVYDRHGRAVEHLTALYRPDMHAFHMSFGRKQQGKARYWQADATTRIRTERRPIPPRRKRP
jgi:GntR family transcriptional regulator